LLSIIIKDFLEPFSYLIYSIAFLLEYRSNKLIKEKVLLIYYIIATGLLTYAAFLALEYASNIIGNNNNWLYNIHYFLSAVALGYYFNNLLVNKSKKRIVAVLFSLVAINFIITDFIITRPFFNSASTAFLFLSVVGASLMYLHELLINMSEKNILLNFNLWLISGYIIYFLGGFFIILSYSYLTDKLTSDQETILGYLWSVLNVLLFVTSIITLSSHLWIAYWKKSQ
jgi:hypothetical protein